MITQDVPLHIKISNNITYIVIVLLIMSALGLLYSISKHIEKKDQLEKYNICVKIYGEEYCKLYFNNNKGDE